MAQTMKYQKWITKQKNEVAKTPLKFYQERFGDIPHLQANIEKVKNLLNYIPSHNFKRELKHH